MKRISRYFALAPAWLVAVGLLTVLAEPSAVAQEQVVVLRNGRVLRGHVTPLGDHFLVGMGEGGEVRVPAAAIEMVCRDLEDAYQRKRADVRYGRIPAHFDLAAWCLRMNLLARAADQILVVFSLDPSHPSLATAVRELDLALSRRGSLQGTIVEVGKPATEPAADSPGDSPSTLDEPATVSAELPRGAVEYFTSRVQPLLLNRCAANACHGTGSTLADRTGPRLSLQRPLPGRPVSRRLTQQNLAGVLPFVDRSAPAASPLLTAPSRPHGGLEHALLNDEHADQFAAIAEWLGSLATNRQKQIPPTLREPLSVLSQARGADEAANNARPAHSEPTQPEPDATATDAAVRDTASTDEAGDEYRPRDPFDPELFNRRWVND